CFKLAWLSPWWFVVPAFIFLFLAVWHDRVLRAKSAMASAVVFYHHGIARIEDRWTGTGRKGERFIDEHHPYANDLDLFGPGSLFDLLSLARTRIGENTLAAWLKAPASVNDARLRQQAVEELRDQPDFREAVATGGRGGGELDTPALTTWMARTPPPVGPVAQLLAVLLAPAIVATVWWWIADG